MPDGDEELFVDAAEAEGGGGGGDAAAAAAAAEAAAAEGGSSPDTPSLELDTDSPADAAATTLKIDKGPGASKPADSPDPNLIMSMLLTVSAAITALKADVASIKHEHSSASESSPAMAGTKGAGSMTSTAKQLLFGVAGSSSGRRFQK